MSNQVSFVKSSIKLLKEALLSGFGLISVLSVLPFIVDSVLSPYIELPPVFDTLSPSLLPIAGFAILGEILLINHSKDKIISTFQNPESDFHVTVELAKITGNTHFFGRSGDSVHTITVGETEIVSNLKIGNKSDLPIYLNHKIVSIESELPIQVDIDNLKYSLVKYRDTRGDDMITLASKEWADFRLQIKELPINFVPVEETLPLLKENIKIIVNIEFTQSDLADKENGAKIIPIEVENPSEQLHKLLTTRLQQRLTHNPSNPETLMEYVRLT